MVRDGSQRANRVLLEGRYNLLSSLPTEQDSDGLVPARKRRAFYVEVAQRISIELASGREKADPGELGPARVPVAAPHDSR